MPMAAPTSAGTVTDQPINPDMPRPNQMLLAVPRFAFSLRAAWAPTCRLKFVSSLGTFARCSSFMLKFHEAADETALHLRHRRAGDFFLVVEVEKLSPHRLVELVEVRSADRITHRD